MLKDFLARVRRNLFRPQLRDLAAFLNAHLHENQGATMEEAIAESLPHLGLFRCRELAYVLNTAKGDRLLRDLYHAARLGVELSPPDAYFAPVTLRVLQCEYDDLFEQVDDTDLVILPDVLAEQGQTVEANVVGKTPAGRIVTADLAELPHLLVAGSTGSGKTVFLYTLVVSLLHRLGPEALSLLLIDPKQTDFVYFEGLPHLMDERVIIDAEEAIAYLGRLTTAVLDARTRQLRQARCRDVLDYNTRHPNAPMKPIVVIIDEYADLVQVLDRSGRQEFERRLIRLAQRARNVGIHDAPLAQDTSSGQHGGGTV